MQTCITVLISSIIALFCVLLVSEQPAFCAEPLARITVHAGERTRIDTPVSVLLEGMAQLESGAELQLRESELVRRSGRVPVAAQIEPGDPPRLWWILAGTTPAGRERHYELVKAPGAKGSHVTATKDDKFLQIQMGDTKVLRYNHAPVPPPEGESPLYTRSAFIHPLWSPTGAVLTDIHPADHIHHVGIWMPWTKTKFEGQEVDFWNLKEGQGTVRFVKFLSTTSGPVYGGFQAEQEHVALETAQGEKVVLKEVWDVRVYNVGGPDKGYWLWDFKSTQRCVADSPLHHIKYRYGGFGYRAAAEWKGENASYLTSEGKTRKDGHGTRARWCDTSGRIADRWAGIVHMSHPKNFRHPESMRIWPGFDQEVFFNWAPGQLGDWVMEPGKDHVFRYRLYVHEGKITVPDAERLWRDFAEPPNVTLDKVSKEDATVLFDGTDFSHWTHANGKEVRWEIVGDAMKTVPKAGSIVTKQKFQDFKLHVEFMLPEVPSGAKDKGSGNSGVYLQRRYEIQILDSYGREPANNSCGSLYRVRKPDSNASKKRGEWQSYDITFHAARFDGEGKNARKVKNARVTVVHNGVLIHDNVELPRKTGSGQPEGPEPSAILLQDHGSEIWFRNVWIVPL
jgi:hypothetical protein